ncbi:hypothetical protein NDU88_007097 [Pleurodeles waltl]|uniref:Uncharacterized protein n=1 Tax=Pleurodeles waltl TaxID=8319 RepID=A0AAV7N1B7_PLEWA|nr:hypothetical protein NDU88_007097 [Pleurodeles waltl]
MPKTLTILEPESSERQRAWNSCIGFISSRVTGSLAPFRAGPGSEWHPTGPEKEKAIESGNPVIRIPIDSPGKKLETRRLEEKRKVVGDGNPDIWVPEKVKREEVLCAGRIEEEKDAEEEDAEEGRTEIADREDNEEDENNSDPHLGST